MTLRNYMKLTQEEIKTLFNYDEATGILSWAIHKKGSKGKGKPAGTLARNGYIDVSLSGKKYGVHRLIFLWMTGKIPKCVDHINGIKSDNRWTNLRSATYSQNGYNYKGTGSISGYKNVYYDPRGNKKYFVIISTDEGKKRMGYFYTPEEASVVAMEARKQYHKEFSHD